MLFSSINGVDLVKGRPMFLSSSCIGRLVRCEGRADRLEVGTIGGLTPKLSTE